MLENEPFIRMACFFGVFAVMALWEWLAPRRKTAVTRFVRWPSNFGLIALNTVLARLLLPTTAVGLAIYAEQSGWGLFNAHALPAGISVLASVILLDLALYLQHVLFHAAPVLWRLHRMHHADLHIDAGLNPISAWLKAAHSAWALMLGGRPSLRRSEQAARRAPPHPIWRQPHAPPVQGKRPRRGHEFDDLAVKPAAGEYKNMINAAVAILILRQVKGMRMGGVVAAGMKCVGQAFIPAGAGGGEERRPDRLTSIDGLGQGWTRIGKTPTPSLDRRRFSTTRREWPTFWHPNRFVPIASA